MSNTNEIKIIDLNESQFVSKEDIDNGYANVNYEDAKDDNWENLMKAISDAAAKRIIINIPNETFSFSKTIALTGLDHVKIVNNGVIEVDPVPLPKTEDNNTGTSTPETGDNGTENTDSETDNTETENQNQNTDNNGDDDTPAPKAVFEFINCAEVSYEGGTIKSDHTNARINYAPKGHSRVKDVYTSMRTAISATSCGKVEIKNAQFSGLECAILLITPQDPENPENDLRNGDVTISNIKVTDTGQPIFVADTNNVTIENADMTSRENMGSGDHFIYCSRNVGNVYIKDCKLDYKDHNYGCAINLRNSEPDADSLNNSVKFCRIDNVEVTNMYRQFVSAKADTRIICNNCKVSTRNNLNGIDSSVANNYIAVFFVGQRASIDVINCIVVDQINKYMIASLCDDVQVNISGGKFTGLKMVGNLGATAGNEMNSINLNVSSAEIETYHPYIGVDSKTKAYFYANFNNCKLFTHAGFYFRSDTENCRIACYNCGFKYIKPNDSPIDRIPIAYHAITIPPTNPEDKPLEESRSLLDNIKVINCTGDGTKGVAHFGQEGKSTAYGNYFSYTEDGVTKINSTCVPDGSITLNMFSPELKTVLNRLLTTS